MLKKYTVRGVPLSIAMDAWWINCDAGTGSTSGQGPLEGDYFGGAAPGGKRISGLILLVLLGELLFWDTLPGFSLAIFAMAVFATAVVSLPKRGNIGKPAVLMMLSTLPVIEHVQLLSVCVLVLGGFCALGSLRIDPNDGVAWVAAAAVKLARLVPLSGALSLLAGLRHLSHDGDGGHALWRVRSGIIWRNWAFPTGGALILGGLLISANPILERVFAELFSFEVPHLPSTQRVMFWLGLGLFVWPLINPPRPELPLALTGPSRRINLGLNCGSMLRALLLFNALLLIQTLLDISILVAGAELPENMSYAAYAHRGAYPLLLTAMLAGAFTFAARPFLNEHRWIRPLLLMWVAQNVLLTLSSVMRLELYISEYGLTYLRIYALIWMGLVAIGLLITLWHVLRAHRSLRLLGLLSGLGFGTLYLCSFVNFAGIIATHTIERAADPETRRIDWTYVCALGSTADKAISEGLAAYPNLSKMHALRSCHAGTERSLDWRELDFRKLRTRG